MEKAQGLSASQWASRPENPRPETARPQQTSTPPNDPYPNLPNHTDLERSRWAFRPSDMTFTPPAPTPQLTLEPARQSTSDSINDHRDWIREECSAARRRQAELTIAAEQAMDDDISAMLARVRLGSPSGVLQNHTSTPHRHSRSPTTLFDLPDTTQAATPTPRHPNYIDQREGLLTYLRMLNAQTIERDQNIKKDEEVDLFLRDIGAYVRAKDGEGAEVKAVMRHIEGYMREKYGSGLLRLSRLDWWNR